MTDEKKKWDDIPSLEGLEIDWEFKPENPLGKRSYERMKNSEVASLFKMKEIPVQVATGKKQFKGRLYDICEGGLAIDAKTELVVKQPVKVGFFLGRKKIISRATVRWTKKIHVGFRIGVMFVKMSQEDSDYIAGVYASKKINR